MNTQARPYQGYGYVNPSVIDIPSVDPETAARWANLPKKTIVPTVTGLPENRTGQNNNERTSGKEKKDRTERPVVYIEVPGLGTSCHSRVQNTNDEPRSKEKKDPTEMPVVYIDLPATDTTSNSRTQPDPEPSSDPESEEDPAELPVVYIDLPNGDESIVSGPRKETNTSSTANSWSQSGSSASHHQQYRPPVSFDFTSPSSSGYSSQSSSLPPLMQKETSIYHRPIPSDDFSLSPIPVSEFPEPPPAYSEVAVHPKPSTSTVPVPPRTQVFGPNIRTPDPQVLAPNRLHCHHCGHTVSTIVELKSGLITHVSAFILLMCCLIPCIPIVYCTTPLKYQNYYCPECYKQIAYKVPIVSQGVQIFKE